MKAEMGLDERNSSCFLHSYSVAMVLRKVTSTFIVLQFTQPMVE